jgi:hypothetical protein
MFRKIYIHVQLICIAKTRNGKLVALAWKQPLQEKLDIDSEESDPHALNIICDTDKDNDDFCVDFMDEEDNWRGFNISQKTKSSPLSYFAQKTSLNLVPNWYQIIFTCPVQSESFSYISCIFWMRTNSTLYKYYTEMR